MYKVDKKIMIHAYKRNGWLYRVWEFPKIIDVTDKYVCVSLFNSRVTTNEKFSKRNFHSKNLKQSYWFFFFDEWYNVIATLSPNDDQVINYYVNFSSPFIYEEEAIKYYDFDLDIKMKNTSVENFKLIDIDEYNENKEAYKYEKEIIYKMDKVLEQFNNLEFRKEMIKLINPKLLKQYVSKEEGEK